MMVLIGRILRIGESECWQDVVSTCLAYLHCFGDTYDISMMRSMV